MIIETLALAFALASTPFFPPAPVRPTVTTPRRPPAAARGSTLPVGGLYVIHGFVIGRLGRTMMKLSLRNGAPFTLDATIAEARDQTGLIFRGRAVSVVGAFDSAGVLHAISIDDIDELDVTSSVTEWPPDGPL